MNRRRYLQLLAIFFVSFFGLAACSQGSGATHNDATSETRIVTDVDDHEIEVPTKPERVVSLSEPTLDGLLALGVTPVGAVNGRGQQSVATYLPSSAKEIPNLGTVGQPNFEAIGAAEPDLILVDGTSINNNQPLLDQLAEIAPVVNTGNAGGDWKKNLERVADAMNMQEKGEEVVKEYEDEVASAREKLGKYIDSDTTFSIVRWQGNAAAVILKELPAGRALDDLGLKRPSAQDHKGRGHSEPVSIENLGDIDADYMFFGTLGGSSVNNPNAGGSADSDGAANAIKQAEEVPGFKELKAYKDNHVMPVDGSAWTSTGGPLLMKKIISDVVAKLS